MHNAKDAQRSAESHLPLVCTNTREPHRCWKRRRTMVMTATSTDAVIYVCPECGWSMAEFRGVLIVDERHVGSDVRAALELEYQRAGIASQSERRTARKGAA